MLGSVQDSLGAREQMGLINATRGSGGGYRLRRVPDEIFLMEVVDLFDRSRIDPT
jgi:DNA-binding IscR family transcriptional regulator